MGSFLVVAGRLRFPSEAALAKWKALKVDGAAVGEWSEPLGGAAGDPFDAMTVEQALAQATAQDFAAGRFALRTDGLVVSLAAGLDEGDGVAVWAPLIVAAARRASSVKGKGELVLGYADEEGRTYVGITARGSRMEPIDDDESLALAHYAVTPAVELYTGARTTLDAPPPEKKAPKKKRAPSRNAAPPVNRPLRWKRVTSGVTSSLFTLARDRSGAVWAAGDGGALVTGPLEGPWAPVETGTTTAFYDVVPEGDRRVWVAGYALLRSDDGGKSFVRCTPPGVAPAITSVWAEGDRVVAVDATGCIHLSTDAGASWSVVHRSANEVAFNRVREGAGALWAGGGDGVLVSRDRGATWERFEADDTTYVDVVFPGGRPVLVSYDRVLSGDPLADVSPKHHRDTNFGKASVNAAVLWVVHVGLIRSADYGATWEQTYARESDFPFAVLGLGPTSALVVGPRGSAWLAK